MNKRGTVATLLSVALIGMPVVAIAVCVAVITTTIAVNGIVVSPSLPGAPAVGGVQTCQGDPGWNPVLARPLAQIYGTDNPASTPWIFLASGIGSNDTFYIGLHMPVDADLRRQDRLGLYFDADNNGAFGNGDFALVYDIGKTTPIASGESCDSVPGQVRYYPRGASAWGTMDLNKASIKSMFAFDYDKTDPESTLWELEVGIDAPALGLTGPFRLGAILYKNDDGDGGDWQTWKWPPELTADGDPYSFEPGWGTVTGTNLAPIEWATCGDVVIDEISATDRFGNSNKFTRPVATDWVAGPGGVNTLPASKQNHFTATVRFYNPSNPMDASATPNSGNVDFIIRPWGAGVGFLESSTMRSETVTFDHFGQTKTVPADWPRLQSEYALIQPAMTVSGHACLKVQLNGFLVNQNPASDYKLRNLTYTTLSTRVDTFLVSARSAEFRENTGTTEFLLRGQWKNLARNASGWEFRVRPADTLGLKDLGNGSYSFTMPAGVDRRFAVEMVGGNMPISSKQYTIDARAGGAIANPADGGPPVQMTVKEGQTVTFVAEGLVRVWTDTLFNGADGRSEREYRGRRYLVDGGAYAPYDHIGGIIASFDRKRWFIIGADASVIVPAGATEMFLAINDVLGEYHGNTGAFTLYAFVTDPHRLPTQLVTPSNPVLGRPVMAEPAADLPQLNIDVFEVRPFVARPGRAKPAPGSRLLIPRTYVTYAVYATHADKPPLPPPPPGGGRVPGCGAHNARGFAAFLGVGLLGILILRRRTGRGPRRPNVDWRSL